MYLPPNNGSDFVLTPSGTHLAICYRVIDLGTQQGEYMGQPKLQHKIMLTWELPDEKMDDGRPFSITNRYTFSSSEKALLRAHLESWRGRKFTEKELSGGEGGFNIKNVIGVPCLLTVIHNTKGDKTYANIGAVSALPKGMKAPAPSNEPVFFSLHEFNQAVFDKLSDGLKATIQKSPEYQALKNPPYQGDQRDHAPRDSDDWTAELNEDCPF